MEKKEKRGFLSILSLLIIFVMLTGWVKQAQSQEKYPTRAIDLICPFVPGGLVDLGGRLLAENLKKKWRVPVNVINKPGGNTIPANMEVYQAHPDGYTVLADSQSSCSLLEVAMRDLPLKVLDRTFIALTTASPHCFIVHPESPLKNLKDAEAEVKRDPEHFTWASFGGVGAGDFVWRQFFKEIGVDVLKTKPVVCRGGSEILSLVASGNIKIGASGTGSTISYFRAGTVRVVGVSGFRVPEFQDVPTAVEQGYPTVTAVFWTAITGPPKLPSHIVNKWEEALQEISRDPEYVSKLKNIGAIPFYRNARETREHVRKEMEEGAKLWGLK